VGNLDFEPGTSIGEWIIEKQLGAGGMGSVHLCHHRDDPSNRAALKLLDATPTISDAKTRFEREAEVLRNIDHPGIARFVDYVNDPPALVMEYVEGMTVSDMVRAGPTPVPEALRITRLVVEALTYLHARGIWHRDVKPANLLIDNNGWVRLVDFGIAVAEDHARLTGEGFFMGSLPYIPPEALEQEPLEPASWDLYSLGVVLFEMVTGRIAFASEDPDIDGYGPMGMLLIAKGRAPYLDPGKPLSDEVRELVKDMTRREPADRISLSEVARRVMAMHTPRTSSAPPTPPVTETPIDHEAATEPIGGNEPIQTAHIEPSSQPVAMPRAALLAGWGLTMAMLLAGLAAVVLLMALVVVFSSPSQPDAWVDAEVVVAGIDASTPVQITLDGAGPTQSDGVSFSWSGIAPGQHSVFVMAGAACDPERCSDGSCPCCATQTESWMVDAGRPLVLHLTPPDVGCVPQARSGVAEATTEVVPTPSVPQPDAPAVAEPVVAEPIPGEVAQPAAAPMTTAASKPVSFGQYSRFVRNNRKWEAKKTVARGDADAGYLAGWQGLNVDADKRDRAVVSVSFEAASAYCDAGRGGLADVSDGPWTWDVHSASGTTAGEIRVDNGAPAVRFSMGVVSGDLPKNKTDVRFGFRCRR